jgi:hypothetical protein
MAEGGGDLYKEARRARSTISKNPFAQTPSRHQVLKSAKVCVKKQGFFEEIS